MDKEVLNKLEFDKVLRMLAERTHFEGGEGLAWELRPFFDKDLVVQKLNETEEAMELLRFNEPSFLNSLKLLDSPLNKARVGGILTPPELLDIHHLLRASRLALKYTSVSAARILKDITEGITENKLLEKQLQDVLDEDGQLRNDASAELKNLRRQIETLRLRIKNYLQDFIRSSNNQTILQDVIVTERAGRYVVPVKQEHRHEVKGIVHDESASGATVFIEPLAVVEQNNKIRSLEIQEKREVERILRHLSMSVSVFTEELEENLEIMSRLDLIFARAQLAYDMNAYKPEINNAGIVEINRARHPLLGDKAVPVNIEIGKKFDIMVITGPNTGGKTVVLKTTGLLSLMAMSGLYIPAREKSKIAVFKNIYVDIGDEQSIEQSLSTFSSHMKNLVHILNSIDDKSLVLLDELGAGTDPVEGSALARAILEEMKIKKAKVIVTTHQSELKTFAYQNSRVENACVEFNPVTLLPSYELTTGTPGQSNAFQIALRLGLNKSIVKAAQNFVPQREAEVGNMIRQLKESRYHFEEGNKELEAERIKLNQEKQQLDEEKKNFYKEKDLTIARAKKEADQYVRSVKREANEAIDELKQLIKNKEKPPKWHELEKKSKKIKDLSVDLSQEDSLKEEHDIKLGDYVKVKTINQKGYVVEGPNAQGEVQVQVGIIKLSVKKEQLQLTESIEEKTSRFNTKVFVDKARHISPEIDIRGQISADALIELDKYLEDAVLVGLDRVRIIHGKGTGALRKAVREYLKGHRCVKDYGDGMREEGGFGVTVAHLK